MISWRREQPKHHGVYHPRHGPASAAKRARAAVLQPPDRLAHAPTAPDPLSGQRGGRAEGACAVVLLWGLADNGRPIITAGIRRCQGRYWRVCRNCSRDVLLGEFCVSLTSCSGQCALLTNQLNSACSSSSSSSIKAYRIDSFSPSLRLKPRDNVVDAVLPILCFLQLCIGSDGCAHAAPTTNNAYVHMSGTSARTMEHSLSACGPAMDASSALSLTSILTTSRGLSIVCGRLFMSGRWTLWAAVLRSSMPIAPFTRVSMTRVSKVTTTSNTSLSSNV